MLLKILIFYVFGSFTVIISPFLIRGTNGHKSTDLQKQGENWES